MLFYSPICTLMVPPCDDLWEPFESSFFQITYWGESAKICFTLFSQSFLVLPSYFFPTQSEKSQFNLLKNQNTLIPWRRIHALTLNMILRKDYFFLNLLTFYLISLKNYASILVLYKKPLMMCCRGP